MKKLSTLLIMAFALVLGLTQCKKKNVDTIATPNNLGEAVYITVNVGGDKHTVNPGTGEVNFENGDVIYVGNGGHYIGTLTYNGSAFSGIINGPSTADYLHFYFVGGLTPSATPEAGTTTDCTVSIANQSSKLPVLSYGRSTDKYTTSSATYSCTLANKCGLVKFVPAEATSEPVRVHGMKTTATIDFANPGITPTNATGTIALYPENDEAKWAILLPQAEVSTPDGMIGKYGCTMSKVPEVTENMYYTSVNMDAYKPGMLGGLFTINPGGGKVHFSQGNLQYIGSDDTPYWQFADNQYDYLRTTTGQDSDAENVDRDLFGWGTTGYQDTRTSSTGYQTNYYPYSTSNTAVGSSAPAYNINNYGYGPDYDSSNDYGLTVANKSDWGMHAISNGGNTQNFGWRTLTSAEWAWVLGPSSGADPGTNCRTSSTVNNIQNARFAKATVNSKAGVIIFPDNYTHPSGVKQPTNINGYTSDYTGNSYDATQWSSMESAGAVFLPAAGYRDGTTVDYVGSDGYYWSSTAYSAKYAYYVSFYSSNFNPSNRYNRYDGRSVRLVIACE